MNAKELERLEQCASNDAFMSPFVARELALKLIAAYRALQAEVERLRGEREEHELSVNNIVVAAIQRAEKAEAENQGMLAVVGDCIEYFEARADAEYLPGRAAPVGNEEMRLLVALRDCEGDGDG